MNLIAALIWFLVVIGLIAAIVGIIRQKNRGSGIATLTAFHDLQAKDKQNATETVIEMKAGKRMSEQASGSSSGEPKRSTDAEPDEHESL